MSDTPIPRPRAANLEARFLTGIFVCALLYSLCAVGYHWRVGFMSGHEFRQSQTAIISYYIDRQDNFGLLYETPILGKPWVSNIMEVPVYEWVVVLLSRATGWNHVVCARTVSALCFYLTLPALYLLLGRLGLARPRRLLVLALVLAAPVYIYYSRAFLMDSMALMASAWFLLGFVRTMDERRWSWLLLATVAGTAAALVKSATLAVWLVPGAAYGAWLLWRDLRARTGWQAPLRTLLWGGATVVVALGALRAWILYTDPIKEAHASAFIFSSKALTQGNWGLFSLQPLLAAETWRFWFGCWEQAIMSRWLIAGGLLLGLALPAVRGRVLALGALFFLAQFLFPFAYAYQDYYYYSCAVYVLGALGFTLVGLLDTRLPRALVAVALLVLLGAEVETYRRDYFQGQRRDFSGDMPYTAVLRELTPENSVLVVAGADWAAVTPYYAQRKALMVRNGLEFDEKYLRRAFKDLADEDVSAVVLLGPLRQNHDFINLAATRFEFDPRAPTFSSPDVDVYVARPYTKRVREGLRDTERYPELTAHPEDEAPERNAEPVTPEIAQGALATVTPAPYQMRFFLGGASRQGRGADSVIIAQPDSDLWLKPPAGATHITWAFGIFPGAYEKPEARTDGVEFTIWAQVPGMPERRLYRRLLDPWNEAVDRGDQWVTLPYTPSPGERLRFSSGPAGGSAYDWSYWVSIEVK